MPSIAARHLECSASRLKILAVRPTQQSPSNEYHVVGGARGVAAMGDEASREASAHSLVVILRETLSGQRGSPSGASDPPRDVESSIDVGQRWRRVLKEGP